MRTGRPSRESRRCRTPPVPGTVCTSDSVVRFSFRKSNRELICVLVSVLRVLLEALGDDPFHLCRTSRVDRGRRGRLVADDGAQNVGVRPPIEWPPAGDHLVKDDPREKRSLLVSPVRHGLLRRTYRRPSEDFSGLRQFTGEGSQPAQIGRPGLRMLLQKLGQPEVEDLGVTVRPTMMFSGFSPDGTTWVWCALASPSATSVAIRKGVLQRQGTFR